MTTIEPSDRGEIEPVDMSEIALKDLVRIFRKAQPDIGGWLFGAEGGNLTPAGPVLDGAPDDAEGSLVIGTAVAALDAFGDALTRAQARLILPLWRHYPSLTAADVVAVLRRFPSTRGGAR